MESFALMFVGLAFFLLIVLTILRDERATKDRDDRLEHIRHQRKIDEAREFGVHERKHLHD